MSRCNTEIAERITDDDLCYTVKVIRRRQLPRLSSVCHSLNLTRIVERTELLFDKK